MKVEEFIHCFSSAGESWVTFLESRILHNVYTTALGKQMLPWTFPIPLLPTIFCCSVQRHMVQGNAFSYLRPGVLAISLLNLLPIPSLLTLGWEGGRKPWHCISAAHQVPKCISNTVLDINAKHGTFGAAVKKLNVLTPSQLDPLPAAGTNTSCHTTKWRVSIISSMQINGLWSGNCVWSWISASVCWKQQWQCWNIAKFVPDSSH